MLKVYMVNMDRNPERLAFMRSNFEKLGVPFERLPVAARNDERPDAQSRAFSDAN